MMWIKDIHGESHARGEKASYSVKRVTGRSRKPWLAKRSGVGLSWHETKKAALKACEESEVS